MAQTFFPITPQEFTVDQAGSWRDVDVSSVVPSGATGVIIHTVNKHASNDWDMGLRKNGSTDDRHTTLYDSRHWWGMIGVDANRVFEAYVGSTTDIDIYVVGYTKSGVTFKTNADDKSLGTTGSWQDIDCSTEAPSAIGLIFEIYASYIREFGFRKNGSSDDRHVDNSGRCCFGAIIGCDASQVCEGYIEATLVDFFLVGYVTDGCTFNTNASDVSLGGTGAWTDLSALPAGANMGFVEVVSGGAYLYGLRKNGSSEDIYFEVYKHLWGIVECDASQVIEGKISDTVVDFFVVGYSEEVTLVEKSSSDTGSGSEVSSPIATLSKADSGSGIEALLSRVLGVAEAGSGAEVCTLLATLVATGEAGAGVEFASKAFSSTDSGSGIESLVTRLLATSETGTGTENLLSRLLRHTDSGLGADAGLTLVATLARAETGSGLDALIGLMTALATSDTGLGADELLDRSISLFDTGSGLDAAILCKAFLSTDSGVGLEALADLLALIITTETGSALEQLRAKIMTSAGADDMKLPTKMGKAEIPSKGVNL
ncbi:MAG: hypothetical protein JSW24_00395 [Dehalococcoidia bacterium]|nr:MAG: hypothetical protein JSW24_00395 [Dehalococcoidia bacterium]